MIYFALISTYDPRKSGSFSINKPNWNEELEVKWVEMRKAEEIFLKFLNKYWEDPVIKMKI